MTTSWEQSAEVLSIVFQSSLIGFVHYWKCYEKFPKIQSKTHLLGSLYNNLGLQLLLAIAYHLPLVLSVESLFDLFTDVFFGMLFLNFFDQLFRTSSFRRVWKRKIKNPCRELKTQKSHWKIMVAFPTASSAKIHVIPSKMLQENAILISETTIALSIFLSPSDNFIAFSLPCRCRLHMTITNVTVLPNKIAPTGTITAI